MQPRMLGFIVNDKFAKMRNQMVLSYCRMLSQNLPGQTKKIRKICHDHCCGGRKCELEKLEY